MEIELKLIYNPDTQTVSLKYNPNELKTWEFILGIIEMGKLESMRMRQLAQIVQAQQQMQNQMIKSAVLRP